MRNDLKIGDKVLVYTNCTFVERIFINYGHSKGVVCVYNGYEEQYLKGQAYLTAYWGKKKWKHNE